MVIFKILEQCEHLRLPIDADIVGARLAALAESRTGSKAQAINANGADSEVRLKD